MNSRLLAALLLLTTATPGAAQESPNRPNNVTLDATALGGSLYYVRRTGPGVAYGFGGGVGGDFLSVMVVGGRHFAEGCCIAYEDRDAAGNEMVFEVLHLDAFRRSVISERFEYDVGIRASGFFHMDDSDDDPGGGWFGGLHGGVYYGWRNFKLGPQVMAGMFNEGSGTNEFGVLLTPISVRAALSW